MTLQIAELNRLSLFAFKDLFAELQPPPPQSLRGIYKGLFVGPGWVRALARPLLTLTGMGDWRGKDFDRQGNAVNLVMLKGQVERRFPMVLEERASLIDGKPGFTLGYISTNPFPWPWIVDELRSLAPGLVLGMTMLKLRPLQVLALPFVLKS